MYHSVILQSIYGGLHFISYNVIILSE